MWGNGKTSGGEIFRRVGKGKTGGGTVAH
jgi:hypothetical protein